MPVKSEFYDSVCVLSPDGDLTITEGDAARTLVEEAIDDRQVVDFVVDFEACGHVDSEGLEILLWIKARCEQLFGQVKLVNLDENLRKIMEITRLAHRFDATGDLAGALKAMR